MYNLGHRNIDVQESVMINESQKRVMMLRFIALCVDGSYMRFLRFLRRCRWEYTPVPVTVSDGVTHSWLVVPPFLCSLSTAPSCCLLLLWSYLHTRFEVSVLRGGGRWFWVRQTDSKLVICFSPLKAMYR